MKKHPFFLTLAAAVAAGCLAAAAQQPIDPTPSEICNGAATKLVRGVTNAVTCPAELPKQIIRGSHDNGFVGGVVGFFTGVEMTVYRCAVGLIETGLFLVPAPDFYAPLAQPPFVWNEWDAPLSQPAR